MIRLQAPCSLAASTQRIFDWASYPRLNPNWQGCNIIFSSIWASTSFWNILRNITWRLIGLTSVGRYREPSSFLLNSVVMAVFHLVGVHPYSLIRLYRADKWSVKVDPNRFFIITACIPSPPADFEELYSRINLHVVPRSCTLIGSAASGARRLAGASSSLHKRCYLCRVHSSALKLGVADFMMVRLDFLRLLNGLTAEHLLWGAAGGFVHLFARSSARRKYRLGDPWTSFTSKSSSESTASCGVIAPIYIRTPCSWIDRLIKSTYVSYVSHSICLKAGCVSTFDKGVST